MFVCVEEAPDTLPGDLDKLSFEDLKAIAHTKELDLTGIKSKAALIAALSTAAQQNAPDPGAQV